eukprot:scaffold41593_cov31-Attheya_sp.AAC.1
MGRPASRGPLYLTPSHTKRMTAHMESVCMAPSDTNGQQTVWRIIRNPPCGSSTLALRFGALLRLVICRNHQNGRLVRNRQRRYALHNGHAS